MSSFQIYYYECYIKNIITIKLVEKTKLPRIENYYF